jgi:DNA-binding transcriptional MerR regulator/quercetin dioxygenase-like cupin family protein
MPRTTREQTAGALGSLTGRDRGPKATNDRSAGVYITQAARITGASPSLIRTWESEGLVQPGRTKSGYRVFTPQDIEQLRRIRDLIHRDGLNAAGVRRVLSSLGTANGASPARAVSSVGEKIREIRRRRGLSLRAVAKLTGISPSAISAVERGHSTPTVGSLHRLARAFDTTVPSLLGTAQPHRRLVVQTNERPLLFETPGVIMENLYDVDTVLQSMLISVDPGAGNGDSYAHEGEEFLYVIVGGLDLTLDEIDTYSLKAGDAMTFASTRPHRWTNPGVVKAVIVWVNTPPTF